MMSSGKTNTTRVSTNASTERSSQASTLTPRQQGKKPVACNDNPSIDESSSESLSPQEGSGTTVVPSRCLTFNDGKNVTQIFVAKSTTQFSVKTKVSGNGRAQVQVLTQYTKSKDGGMQHRKREGYWGDLIKLPDGGTCESQGDVTYGLSGRKWHQI